MLFRHDEQDAAGAGAGPAGSLVVERPPPGLARGKYAVSGTFIVLFGAALVLGTLLYFVLRLRKPRP